MRLVWFWMNKYLKQPYIINNINIQNSLNKIMYNLNGFISDQHPKTNQFKPKYQNLPKQIPKDPYRSNIHHPTINNQHNKQNCLIQTNQTARKKNYVKILDENKVNKYNITSVSTFKKHGNLRNIINTHLFDDDIKKKINKAMHQQPKKQFENRYKTILRQIYGSPLSNNNNANRLANNCQKRRYLSSMKKYKSEEWLLKMGSENRQYALSTNKQLLNGANSQSNRPLSKHNNRSISYKQLHLNKKRLFL